MFNLLKEKKVHYNVSNEIKFCKDCKFFKVPLMIKLFGNVRIYSECTNEEISFKEISLVTGHKRIKYNTCVDMRVYSGSCGKNAKYFEPKEEINA